MSNQEKVGRKSHQLFSVAIGFLAFFVPTFAWLAETNISATLNGLADWEHISYFQVWGPILGIGIAAVCLGFGIYIEKRRSVIVAAVLYCTILSSIAFWYMVIYPCSEWRW